LFFILIYAPLGANIRREIFQIFKESVNNIVKHSGATVAEIDFILEKDVLILILKDNGRGFDLSANNSDFDWKQNRGGNGLLSMRRRAEELGGEYKIESEIGKGTIATLRVPVAER
jgi:signal transduction histidine kinase